MDKDVESTYKALPTWPAIERGLESLSTLENSINSKESHTKKGLTLRDLLIKVCPCHLNPRARLTAYEASPEGLQISTAL